MRFHQIWLMTFGWVFAAGLGWADVSLPVGDPDEQGMSSERLERIDRHMNKAVDDELMVGGMAMIARNNKIVYESTWGQRDRERNLPMTSDTLFRIYSMTKPITSVAVLMLYEEGRFHLNDPIARYIPELADLRLAASTADGGVRADSDGTVSRTAGEGDGKVGLTRAPARQPTIRDLLRHTAGFTYGLFGNTEVDRAYRDAGIPYEHDDLEAFVTALGQVPLQFEPGSRWHYSVSVDVQGRLIEAVSGMRFSDFLHERIFAPLGMRDTFFRVPPDKAARLAQLYQPEGTGEGLLTYLQPSKSNRLEVAHASTSANYQPEASFESGGGGLVSSASDYMRFALMLLNDGELDGTRILSRKTVELMTTDHLGAAPFGRPGQGFGLGVGVVLDPGEVGELASAGEFYWGGAAGTRFWVDPQEELVTIFMVQSRPHRTSLRDTFKHLVYQAIAD